MTQPTDSISPMPDAKACGTVRHMTTYAGPIRGVARGIYDGPHATPPQADSGPVFLGIKNITSDGRLDLSEIKHVSEEHYPRWIRRVEPRANDIVFSYEATLHRYAIVPEGFRGCLGRRLGLIRPNTNRVVPRFLHYYLLSTNWRSVVETHVVNGATVDRIPILRFPEFEIRIPNLDIQRSVVSTLAAYDDLIENNRRRIRLLEQAARTIYEEWFIRFLVPDQARIPRSVESRRDGEEHISRSLSPHNTDSRSQLQIDRLAPNSLEERYQQDIVYRLEHGSVLF